MYRLEFALSPLSRVKTQLLKIVRGGCAILRVIRYASGNDVDTAAEAFLASAGGSVGRFRTENGIEFVKRVKDGVRTAEALAKELAPAVDICNCRQLRTLLVVVDIVCDDWYENKRKKKVFFRQDGAEIPSSRSSKCPPYKIGGTVE